MFVTPGHVQSVFDGRKHGVQIWTLLAQQRSHEGKVELIIFSKRGDKEKHIFDRHDILRCQFMNETQTSFESTAE
jgi:hypothetical protein